MKLKNSNCDPKNRKTLPWEHRIGCQMCEITLSKSNKKKNKDSNDSKNQATFFSFLSSFGKSNLTHLTTDVLKAAFYNSRDIFLTPSLTHKIL